jgi:predicted MFS family arabinose efflux permease
MAEARPQRSAASAITLGSVGTVVAVLPAFLTGAMAVQLSESLAFGIAALGVAVGAFWGAGAISSFWFGRFVDNLGASRSMQIAAAISAVSMTGIATLTHSWRALVFWLIFGSIANVLAQPAANRLLVNAVEPGRLGLSFGIKQSAPPLASSLGGISVPLIALTLGWQYAYGIGALLSLFVIVAARRGAPPKRQGPPAPRVPLGPKRGLVLYGLSFGLAVSATSAVPAFYVDAAVRSGLTPSLAGTLLGIAGFLTICTRLLSGVIVDRMRSRHLIVCAVQLGLGAVGLGLLALGHPVAMTIGVMVAMTLGWSFNGVFWFAMVRAYPASPGAITGVISPAGLGANTISPLLFGALAEQVGYGAAWAAAAIIALLAVVAFIAGDHQLRADTAVAPRPPNP